MAAAVARPLPPSSSHLSSTVADDATTTSTTTTTYTVDIVNLNNLLSRLEHNIFSSTLDLKLIQQSHLHRTRVGANVEYANTLFTKIERSLPSIKSPETRHQRTTDLANKRARLARLRERFEEIKTEDYNPEEQDEEKEGEDLLAGFAPVEEEVEEEKEKEGRDRGIEQAGKDEAAAAAAASSTLRQRRPDVDSMSIAASSTTPAAQSSLVSTSTTTGFKPSPTTATTSTTSANTETTLSTHRAEQESLTDSLINLASQLKASSQAFQSSLENEKSILDRAVEGLDRNVTGLDAAGQRMGVLRRMSEGKGWWGRMLMYAWIFGLWLVAIAIVYLGPKLRF